jgi:serine/threonine protein kinase
MVDSKLKFQAGNAFWSAPEVVKGEPYDLSADIFSLGIVFVELLTNADPSDFDQVPRVNNMSVDFEPVKKRVLPMCAASEDWIELTGRCLQLSPSLRPTATDAVRVLASLKDIAIHGKGPRKHKSSIEFNSDMTDLHTS